MSPITERITSFFDKNGLTYNLFSHNPSRTSEESAACRGDSVEYGAKALVLKVGDQFALFVMRANLRLDLEKVGKLTGTKPKKIRFATSDELMTQTGLVSGAVPPLGQPVLPLTLFIDHSIELGKTMIGFNAGTLTASIRMSKYDYLRIANGQLADFTTTKST